MNGQRSFERLLADRMEAERGSPRLPDALYDDFRQRARRTRQRPQWLALIKEPPMRYSSRLAVGSPTARVAAILVATLMLALLVAGVGVAGSRLLAADGTIVVAQDGSGEYTTITDAVAAAGDGDMILVRPGTYVESVVIENDITIRGDGPREEIVVDIADDGPQAEFGPTTDTGTLPLRYAFWFDDADATLSDVTIHGPGRDVSAIVVIGGDPTVQRVVADLDENISWPQGFVYIRGDAAGTFTDNVADVFIWVDDTASPLFERNVIGSSVKVTGESEARFIDNDLGSLWVQGRAAPVVEGNRIDFENRNSSFAQCGIELLEPETRPIIVRNVVRNARTGICVSNGEPAVLEGNEVIDSDLGISLSRSDAEIRDNVVTGGVTGIAAFGGGSPSLIDNTIAGTSNRGVSIGPGTSPTLQGNKVCGNATNLDVHDDADPRIDDSNEICEDDTAD